MIWWPLWVVLLVLAGRVWARLPLRWGRLVGWTVMLLALLLIELELRGADPILRMIAFCCGSLGGLKAIAYLEWSREGRKSLRWGSYLGFGFAWFGMDPGPFRRVGCRPEWRSSLKVGLACVISGTLLGLLVRGMGWTALLLVFIPMSLGFHYGALRVLTAGWRAAGIPVRVLFRNPLVTTGLGDFWGRRWNLGYSEMMVRVVKRPLEGLMSRSWADACVFLVSGLLHEVAITVPVGEGYGRPTLYFLLHGIAVKLEKPEWPLWGRRLWVAVWVIGPMGLLFPPAFHEEVILRCLLILPELTIEN